MDDHVNNRHAAAQSDAADLVARTARWRLFRQKAADFAADLKGVPPFTVDQLFDMAKATARRHALELTDDSEKKVLALMIHNAVWLATLAATPFERRLLLLPQCLRTRAGCQAATDAYGLLCDECGRCPLGNLQQTAAALGYTVLIAEGTGAVTGLLKQGRMDAVIGASCMPALEQSFRHIAEEAVPALAVPLLRDGCDATAADLEMLNEYMRLRSRDTVRPAAAPDSLRALVRQWFRPDTLKQLFKPAGYHAPNIALEWLAGGGKRWRPLLTAAVYDALRDTPLTADDDAARKIAVAAECFHKASLIHDDIEDHDDLRDGQPTLHARHGIPVALNAGDLLLGEGYRLLTATPINPADRLRMLAVAADGHRRLCLGQGEELRWRQAPDVPAPEALIDLFALKTAPAFEVAILLGAIAGGADEAVCATLADFSRALGVAYQIRDDLADISADTDWTQTRFRRPSILLALLGRKCAPDDFSAIRAAVRDTGPPGRTQPDLCVQYRQYDIAGEAQAMMDQYRQAALNALAPLRSVRLKSVLTRLIGRILPHAT